MKVEIKSFHLSMISVINAADEKMYDEKQKIKARLKVSNTI